MKPNIFSTKTLVSVLIVIALSFGCSNKVDDANYKKYMNQDLTVKGKTGVLITALGQPDQYDFEFYNNYLKLIFNTAFPPILKFFILRDSGTVLRDPDNMQAAKEFKPKTLMDCFGNTKNKAGVPYAQLEVEYVEPREEGKDGHFVLDEENGYIDIVEKSAIKMIVLRYAKLPGKTIPYRQQHEALFKEVKSLLSAEYPDVPVQTAWAMYPATITKAIDELIAQKVETIVVTDLFPSYSNLEEFNHLFVEIDHLVAGRAKVIYTPFIGAYPSFRNAYVQMAADEIAALPKEDKKLVVLNRHGMPDLPGETYYALAKVYYDNLKKETEAAVAGTNTDVLLASTEFAGEEDDEENKKVSTAETVEDALKKGYKQVVFVLVDFVSENTDTVFCAREEGLEPLHFEYDGVAPYNDFTQPFRSVHKKGDTTFIFAGAPVGPKYMPLVSQGIYDAIATVLKGKKWPDLVI
jgi:protoheme ferro-lyase